MELYQLTERVYYTPHDHQTDRPVLGYIRGDRCSLMIDSGNSANHVKEFYQALDKHGFSLPDYTVITHWHWDHTFGMHACTGKTIACENTNRKLKQLSQWEWTDQAMKQRLASGEDIEFADHHIRIEYPDLQKIKVSLADIIFRGSMSFSLGGLECRAIEMPSPHSDDAVIIHIPETDVVFIGDALSPDFYQNNSYDKERLNQMYEQLSTLDYSTCMTGHSEPLNKQEILDEIHDTLQAIN